MLTFLLPFLIVGNAFCSEIKSLSCFTTEEVVYDHFPKFSLEEELTTVVNYTEKDEATTGPPICVMFFGQNGTHSVSWQGHVSSFSLPLQCHIYSQIGSGSSTHCFLSSNKFLFLEISSGWSCCCSTSNCNLHNPYFFEMYEKVALDRLPLLDRLKPICKYFSCIILILCVIVIETLLEAHIYVWFGTTQKVKSDFKKPETAKPAIESSSPGDPFKSPLIMHSIKVQATQPSQKSGKNLSEISMKPIDMLPVEKTQEDEDEAVLLPSSTQSDSDEIVPIPPRPELKMLPNGRMQRTSMNYDESTYSDLQ